MKNLKKMSRNELTKINGGKLNPYNDQMTACYHINFFYNQEGQYQGDTGIPTVYYGHDIPANATNVTIGGFSAIIPVPAGC